VPDKPVDRDLLARVLAQLLTLDKVAELMGWTPGSAKLYRHRPAPGGLPEPDAMVGRTPVWLLATIEQWQQERPGRGHRSDLHNRATNERATT
jgi:predicted DNA-binding transcriptional regulator AlpA